MKKWNIYLHSICFLLLFTAFQTSGGIAQRALTGYQDETVNSTTPFTGIDGYTSNAILYLFFALSNWVAPIVVEFTSTKTAMIVGASAYAIYVATYIYPKTIIMYISSALLGCGAGVLWTAQGAFITDNSDDKSMQKNSSIFWMFLQSAMIWGNLYIYKNLEGVESITSEVRVPMYWIFFVLTTAGTALMIFLKQYNFINKEDYKRGHTLDEESHKMKENEVNESQSTNLDSGLNQKPKEDVVDKCERIFLEAVDLFKTNKMLILCLIFIYTGVHQTFWTGVYPTMIGGTKAFGEDSDRYTQWEIWR